MFLLADSGATKTDWFLFDEKGIQTRLRTSGINPMIQSEIEIRTGPLKDFAELLGKTKVEKVHYYGAGLRTSDKNELIQKLLGEILPDAELGVHHDLLGAARATCGHEPGISCILGTGSNSCWFDGNDILAEIGGNGYVLGDEGSGADLGMTLIKKALDIELPVPVIAKIEEHMGKSLLEIRNEAYSHARPNYYFANFAKFIADNIDDPLYDGIVLSRFTTFLGKTVIKYNGYANVKVHFIGSISKVFEAQLRKACEIFNLNVGRIVQAPAETLVEYHLEGVKVKP